MAGNDISFVARLKDEVSGKLGKIVDNFDRLGKSKAGMAVLQGVGMGAGIRMFTSIEGAIRGVAGVAQDAVRNASNLRESMALAAQVFEDNADEVDAWAATASEAFGMTKREALDTAAQFGNAFKNVGVSIDETAEKSQTLARLAADLGSAFNRSSAEAANALRAGLLGEAEPMRRFGVFLDSVAVEAKLLAMGIKKVGGEFTTSQKVMARYQLIMEQTQETQGMFGRDTGSLADAQKRLESQLEDLSAELGTALLPYLVSFKTALSDLIPVIKSFPQIVEEADDAMVVWGFDIGIITDNALAFIAAGVKMREEMTGLKANAEDQVNSLSTYQGILDNVGTGMKRVSWTTKEAGKAADEAQEPVNLLADAFATTEKEAKDALVALGKFKWDPAELKGAFAEAQNAVKEAKKELQRYQERLGDDKPTAAQQRQLDILAGKLATAEREAYEAEIAMKAVDGLSFKEAIDTVNKYGIRVDWLGDQWRRVLRYMIRVNDEGYQDPGIGGYGGTWGARASGGPVRPFGTYTVGEEGPETLVMGSRGGFVIPGAGGSSGGGAGGSPVTIALQLDGRTIASVVDRHLYYKAARAPQSPTAV